VIERTDLLIAGGGPIGLAAAIEARLAGLEVVVVEPRIGTIDKACGEGLMPGAVPALDRLGVHPRGFLLRGVDYRDGRRHVAHRFRRGHGLGVRRTTLHAAMRERALELGARIVADRVEGVEQGGSGVTAAGFRAGWMLAADGLHSDVARTVGLALPAPAARRRYGQRRHYRVDPWSELIEVHWTSAGEIYVTPTGDGVVGLALLARQGVRFDDALAAAGELAGRVAGAEVVSELRGAGPFRQRTRARVAGRVMLIGDASGYVDALTGEGIRIGLDQARAAVEAVIAGDPERYEREWWRVTRDFRRLTGALVWLATSSLRPAIVPIARAVPPLFEGAVERLAR
jgi:flavin-dependent dehydrogenase